MKATTLKILGLLVMAGIMISSCKKEKIDYRNAFIGDYQFTRKSVTIYHMQGTTSSSTITYPGTVKPGTTDSTIIIPTSSNEEIEMKIWESGELKGCINCSEDPHYSRYGDFYTDSVKLHIGYGGLGGSWYWNIQGKKQ